MKLSKSIEILAEAVVTHDSVWIAELPEWMSASCYMMWLTVALHGEDGIATTAAAGLCGLHPSSATRAAKALVKNGLLSCVPGADRRSRILSLTTQGKAEVKRHLTMKVKAAKGIVKSLGI